MNVQDSTALTGHGNGGDWQEEVYQKIKAMKESYLPELNEMYQKIAAKLQQHDSLPHQPKSDQVEKLKLFKTMLERAITFLQISKTNIVPGYKDKLASYEKQIISFINTNRPRKPVSSLQQGQPPSSHMHSMQQSQSQITQVQCHENQINPQLQILQSQQFHQRQQQQQLQILQSQQFHQRQQQLQQQQQMLQQQHQQLQQQQQLLQQQHQQLQQRLQSQSQSQITQVQYQLQSMNLQGSVTTWIQDKEIH